MDTIPLPPDFKEFLKLLSKHEVRYLLIGGYAVGYHGYVRATADMDIWIGRSQENSKKIVKTLQDFGFDVDDLSSDLFLEQDQVIRMGTPPMRIELLTSISGVEFMECYESKIKEEWDDAEVFVINLSKLKQNKRVSGRMKDLADLEHLE